MMSNVIVLFEVTIKEGKLDSVYRKYLPTNF